YLAYRIVDQSIFENNARAFIDKEINYSNTQVITRNYKYSSKGNQIDLLLLGQELSRQQIDSLRKKMTDYQLGGTQLTVRQGLNAKNELDFSQIKASILEAVYQKDSTAQKVNTNRAIDLPIPDLTDELRSLYPNLVNYSINNIEMRHLDTGKRDTLTMALMNFNSQIPEI